MFCLVDRDAQTSVNAAAHPPAATRCCKNQLIQLLEGSFDVMPVAEVTKYGES